MHSQFALLILLAGVYLSQEIPRNEFTRDRYAAVSHMASGANMPITSENDQLVSKLRNQQASSVFPESRTTSFRKVLTAELEFTTEDRQGRPSELSIKQKGRNVMAKQLEGAAAAVPKALEIQMAARSNETTRNETAENLLPDTPNYDLMRVQLAETQYQQLPLIHLETLVPTAEILHLQLSKIDSLISADLARQPVGSVTAGVVAGKELIWSKSYGDADMENKRAADTDTVYRIGSITKMFTALMLGQLVEVGNVHLSDPVEKYFPEINTVQGRFAYAPPITLVQLATHTSGLAREPDHSDEYVTGALADWEKKLITALPHTHYLFEPGTRFFYSNIGFAVLGAALSRAAGQSYTEYVPTHIFRPLGMIHSALERNAQILPHLAKGYQVMARNAGLDAEFSQREHEAGRGYKVPNGAIYATVGDLARFASFLMGQGPESVLKTATLERFQKQSLVSSDLVFTHGYGIGFEVDRRENYTAFGHGGSVAGYAASLLINPNTGVGVIVLSNGAVHASSLAERALDVLSK
jgi:CubicO group peptidase (beta-lactamase class C family)